jgi:Transcriptional regulator
MTRLPRLRAIQAFEAAARHRSFTAAADELSVTQAAISHQITYLERDLGIPLFRRLTRQVVLTPEGEALARELSAGFERITNAIAVARGRNSSRVATRVPPNFSARWLIPNLPEFREAYPGITLDLYDMNDTRAADEVDIDIQWSAAQDEDQRSVRLMGLSFAPMCTPELNEALGLSDLARLPAAPLLGSQNWPWAEWFALSGIAWDGRLKSYAEIANSHALITAVVANQGVGLCPVEFVTEYLADGRLVQLSDQILTSREAFQLVYRSKGTPRKPVRLFADWLVGKCRAAAGQPVSSMATGASRPKPHRA